jgi:hypothetical protein
MRDLMPIIDSICIFHAKVAIDGLGLNFIALEFQKLPLP